MHNVRAWPLSSCVHWNAEAGLAIHCSPTLHTTLACLLARSLALLLLFLCTLAPPLWTDGPGKVALSHPTMDMDMDMVLAP